MTQEDCISVTNIRIRINPVTEIEITPVEALSLYLHLADLVGPNHAEPVYEPKTYPSPMPKPQPCWINPNTEPWPDKWVVTCGNEGKGELFINACNLTKEEWTAKFG